MNPKLFAEVILLAQKIHEESWNKRTERYGEDQMNSAAKACLEKDVALVWADVIGLLNHSVWNDIQDWANLRRM